MRVPFARPINMRQFGDPFGGVEDISYSGSYPYSSKAEALMNCFVGGYNLLTASCTQALEMSLLLHNVNPGDEVIMPSFNFTSAPAVVSSFGATPVFADIKTEDCNIDPDSILDVLSEKTKAIIVVNYAGNPCNFEMLKKIALDNNLALIEDNAHGLGSKLSGRPLGTFGDVGCHSFHYTKNLHCGEGGAITLNSPDLIERAQIVREKGTNRWQFSQGRIDKYTWIDKGGSFLLSDFLSRILCSQLDNFQIIQENRLGTWNYYHRELFLMATQAGFICQTVTPDVTPSAHMFYLISRSPERAQSLLNHLRNCGVEATQHYQALHLSPGAKMFASNPRTNLNTAEFVSNGIIRLPLWYGMKEVEKEFVVQHVSSFLSKN